MRAGVLGINHKLAGVSLRSLLAKVCEEWFISNGWNLPCVLLSTCNRTEIYFSSEDLAATHSMLLGKFKEKIAFNFDQKLYTYFDRECFSHLCRVASGLDSAVLAETEIQAQVKDAYERAAQQYDLPRHLHFLFQKSLKVSKEVRQNLLHTRGMPTLEDAIFKIGAQFFGNEVSPNILFIGASAINEKIAKSFIKNGHTNISLINRTPTQIEGLRSFPWEKRSTWSQFDWVIVGTKAKDYVLPSQVGHKKKILIHDLSVPSNVDPNLGHHPEITLMNIDEINKTLEQQQKQIHHLLSKAESFVQSASQRQTQIFRAKEEARLVFA